MLGKLKLLCQGNSKERKGFGRPIPNGRGICPAAKIGLGLASIRGTITSREANPRLGLVCAQKTDFGSDFFSDGVTTRVAGSGA
jgi:hypothetical protein